MTDTPEQIARARTFAIRALQARLKMGDPRSGNDKIKRRIAAIKAECLDNAPEVQSALLALLETDHAR